LGLLLPFQCSCPIFVFVFIKFSFPPADGLFAGSAGVIFAMASHAVAVLDIVE
jgi:hypothetical protein